MSPQLYLVVGNNMATKDTKITRRPGLQLKTPKGTRDWVGSDLLLRDHILYVLQLEALGRMLY